MAVEIVVPEMGESVVEATVSRWLKEEGDPVSVGEAIVELETEKVNLEVGAEQAGILKTIERQAGEDVQVGDVLAVVDEDSAAGEHTQDRDGKQEADNSRDESGEASETEESGVESGPEETKEGGASQDSPPAEKTAQKTEEKVTPIAKRLAKEHDVDLAQVPASGERVSRADVEEYLKQQETGASARADGEAKQDGRKAEKSEPKAKKEAPESETPSPTERTARETRTSMSRRRRTIARRLVEAQQNAAMLTTFNEVDMTAIVELRQRRRGSFQERHGVKLGFMSFFVKAVVGALKQFPRLGAEIDGDEIVLKHYYDIGMAIGAEEGLVVPVLRNADRMTFAEIEQEISTFVEKVNEGSLTPEDLKGGSFTITNGGVFGSLLSTPILNPPQVGILGLHKIEKRAVVIDDKVEVRSMMYVALSYDHRIVDGREAVQFLVKIKELIENPETLLLEG
jgi:2-oxoglutarate dehydrogenase E2 component (dihydrolipoamide succinyltransferase)